MKRACSEPYLTGLMRSSPTLSAEDAGDMDNSEADEVGLDDFYPKSEFLFIAKTKCLVVK